MVKATRGKGKRLLLALLAVALAGLALLYWGAIRDPIVRTAAVSLPGWPIDEPPMKILFMSDVHVAGPDMPPERLSRLVAQANGLAPDVVLIGGDLVSDKRVATKYYSVADAVAPLSNLDAREGVFAVVGNHDHWRDAEAFRRELPAHGVSVLENEAAKAGPIKIVGIGDEFTGHEDMSVLNKLGPAAVVAFTHSPDIFPQARGRVPLLFAGHAHCGQIRLPLIGAISTMSRYGDRYACGRIDEEGSTLFVSAGLGTSILPFRLGARPDMWLVTVGP